MIFEVIAIVVLAIIIYVVWRGRNDDWHNS